MCEICIREMAGTIGAGNGQIASPIGPGAAAAGSINTYFASFDGIHQANMLALIYGQRWEQNTLTFSFPDAASDYGSYGSGEAASFSSFNNAQKNAAVAVFGMIEGYANINFGQVFGNQGNAEIRLGESAMPGTAWAYYPSSGYQGGDIWLDNAIYDLPLRGTYAWHTMMHEIGHAIGLKHGHDASGFGAISAPYDQMAYSVMTYRSYQGAPGTSYTNEYYGYAQTFMAYDIAAVQALYGVNWSTNNDGSVYRWSPSSGQMFINGAGQAAPASNRIFTTIWDGGGKDYLDLSNHHEGTTGDMAPGGFMSFSSTQKAQLRAGEWADGNVYFALAPAGSKKKSMIENLFTGNGDDFVYANAAHNEVSLKAGKDFLHGRGGHDVIFGNGGKDFLIGGPGKDTIDGGLGSDTIKGGSGADVFVLGPNSGKDVIRDFTPGIDKIDVPNPGLATLTTSNTGHLTVNYQGSWAILRWLDYSSDLDPLDFVI